jgi:glycine cleavage system aminomethyltransferase T
MGYVRKEFATPGTAVGIEIRGKAASAVVVPKPIYRKPI